MKDVIIINAGQFGREVCTWVLHVIQNGMPWRVKGFLDDRPSIQQTFSHYPSLLGSVESYAVQDNDLFLCAIGDPIAKRRFCETILGKGGRFTNLIHPTAVVGSTVKLGHGIILAPYTALSCDLQVGNFVAIGSFSASAHDTRIGDWCVISGHCGINGNAILEEGVFLGSHSVILPRARVGAWAYVGAGSVVLKSVKPAVKVFGNPAAPFGNVEVPENWLTAQVKSQPAGAGGA